MFLRVAGGLVAARLQRLCRRHCGQIPTGPAVCVRPVGRTGRRGGLWRLRPGNKLCELLGPVLHQVAVGVVLIRQGDRRTAKERRQLFVQPFGGFLSGLVAVEQKRKLLYAVALEQGGVGVAEAVGSLNGDDVREPGHFDTQGVDSRFNDDDVGVCLDDGFVPDSGRSSGQEEVTGRFYHGGHGVHGGVKTPSIQGRDLAFRVDDREDQAVGEPFTLRVQQHAYGLEVFTD